MRKRRWFKSGLPALVAFGGVSVLIGALAFPAISSATIVYQFPPAGTDFLGTTAQMTVQAPCGTGPLSTVSLEGPLTVQRFDPFTDPQGVEQFQATLQSMDLKGSNATLGNVEMTLSPTQASNGMVISDGTGTGEAAFPARSFFDVFVDVNVPVGQTWTNPTPLHMATDGIRFIPPVGSQFSLPPGTTVPLVNGQGMEQACIVGATATPFLPPDHQLCYAVTAKGFKAPTSVTLVNQFNPNGFPVTVTAPTLHCNPVQKTVGGAVYQINNPDAHLLCFHIKPLTPVAKHTVSLSNQFGQNIVMNTNQPNSLCLPTWKSLTGPPVEPINQPPGLDHFTCYPVKYAAGSPKFTPPPVALADEFVPAGTPPVPVTVGSPTSLCLPTTKIVPSGTYPSIDPVDHLLCFKINPATPRQPVWDLNQFGASTAASPVTFKKPTATNSNEQLCLPTTKVLIK